MRKSNTVRRTQHKEKQDSLAANEKKAMREFERHLELARYRDARCVSAHTLIHWSYTYTDHSLIHSHIHLYIGEVCVSYVELMTSKSKRSKPCLLRSLV